MAWSRVAVTVPLLYQQLFYVPPPPPVPPAFVFASTTSTAPFKRTLFYQAEVNPPPPMPQPPLAGQTFAVTSTWARRTGLFYQAKIAPVPLPVVAAAPTIDWQQPFSRPAPGPAPTTRYIPFVPTPPAGPPQGWELTLDGKPGPSRVLLGLAGGLTAPPAPIVPQVTPDQWLQPFGRAIEPVPRNISDVTYAQAPPPAVSNLTTTLEWMVAWQGPPRPLQPLGGGAVSGYQPPAAVSNLTTTLEWQIAWQGPPRVLQLLAGGPVSVPQASNLTTTLEWQTAWQGPPRALQRLAGGLVNVPIASNLTTTLEWQIAWQGPSRRLQLIGGGAIATPIPSNLTTTLEWMMPWQGPPRYWPVKVQAVPFVPREAVLDNTVPPQWQYSFAKAVPVPPVWHTQPVFGYPYVSASNLTTTLEWMPSWQGPPRTLQRVSGAGPVYPGLPSNLTTSLEWMQAWKSPPSYRPLKVQALPFVPREATIDNTITGIAWMQPFYKAAPVPRPVNTQPFFGFPYVAASNLTTSLEWLQAWRGPPRYTARLSYPATPFVPREAVLENTVAFGGWYRGLDRAVTRLPAVKPAIAWSYPPVVVLNTVTIDKWQQPFRAAARKPPFSFTQPIYVPQPPVAAPPAFCDFTVTTDRAYRKTLFYQSLTRPVTFPPANYDQHVTVHLTVDLRRILRFTCKAEAAEGFADAVEQVDPWATQGETADASTEIPICVDAFQMDDAFQQDAFQFCEGDEWVTETEDADAWGEQQQIPGAGCDSCDDD